MNSLLDFDKLYADVMKIDSAIRMPQFKITQVKKSVADLETTSIQSSMMMNSRWCIITQVKDGRRKNIEHKLGNTKYAMAEYDKLKRIAFPINKKYMLLLTTEIDADHANVIDKVLELIRDI